MSPESFAMVIRNQGSTSAQPGDSLTAEEGAHVGTSHAVAASPNQIQAALRIRAALRAALQDAAEDRLPDGQWHEWTWTVKDPPRPPLVVDNMEGLNEEELLANDSLGG